jgi:cellobiose transport system substrate-binding protein
MLNNVTRRVLGIGCAALLAATAGCTANSGRQAAGGKIQLAIADWGNFGFKDLITEYEAAHPNIHIIERVGEYNQVHQNLVQKLAAGSGMPDINAIDEGFIVQFREQSQNFVNFLDNPATAARKADYLRWKWQQSLSADGKTQIGLGTDVGGLAMCYRPSLFKAAGLPADRDEVSKLWTSWQDYIDVGKRFQAQNTGPKWVDSAVSIFNPVISQASEAFYTKENQLVVGTNPQVRHAWDVASNIVRSGLSANLQTSTAPWNAGLQKGSFATMACPSWMRGQVAQNAPATKGDWDVAKVPGTGGNWGGSFLSVPKQGKHTAEAVDLANWLTAPAQQIRSFAAAGTLPSIPKLYDDPAVRDYKDPFFNNAPVGQIFTRAAASLQPLYLGPRNGAVRVAIENSLTAVQQGNLTPEAGWARAVRDAEKANQS